VFSDFDDVTPKLPFAPKSLVTRIGNRFAEKLGQELLCAYADWIVFLPLDPIIELLAYGFEASHKAIELSLMFAQHMDYKVQDIYFRFDVHNTELSPLKDFPLLKEITMDNNPYEDRIVINLSNLTKERIVFTL
jgi:hypothetical protein